MSNQIPQIDQWQWRIQDFPEEGAPSPKVGLFCKLFAENCMKMKEFGPGEGVHVTGAPLDPPMIDQVMLFE